MKKYGSMVLAPILALLLLYGCGSVKKVRIGSFTVISTRNVMVGKLTHAEPKVKARGVEGVYLVSEEEFETQGQAGINAAVENAVNKAAGDMMINCIVYRIVQGSKRGYLVQGDVIETLKDSY